MIIFENVDMSAFIFAINFNLVNDVKNIKYIQMYKNIYKCILQKYIYHVSFTNNYLRRSEMPNRISY